MSEERPLTVIDLLIGCAQTAQALNEKHDTFCGLGVAPEGILVVNRWPDGFESRHMVTWHEIMNSKLNVLQRAVLEAAGQ